MTVIAVAAALAAVAMALPAAAPAATAGKATLISKPSKAKSSLFRQGVKLHGKKGRVVLRSQSLRAGRTATIRLAGKLKFQRGKRVVTFRKLAVRSAPRATTLVGKLGRKRLAVLRSDKGARAHDDELLLRRAPVALTGAAAKALARRFGLDSIRPGRIGILHVHAEQRHRAAPAPVPAVPAPRPVTPPQPPNPDPCALAVASIGPQLTPAPPSPTLAEGLAIGSGHIDWGVRESLRRYVRAGGAVVVEPPAAALGAPSPGFRFPATGGEIANSGSVETVVSASGGVEFCYAAHFFKFLIANPAVVLTSSEARLTAEVESTMHGTLTQRERIDLATLDTSSVTPTLDEGTVRWENVPATLTEVGVAALCGPSGSSPCPYSDGDPLDPVTVEASLP